MKESVKSASRGVPMRWVQFLTMVLVLVLSALIIVMSWRVVDGYNQLKEDTSNYISRQQDADNLMAASDYLTMQARSFAFSGNREYLDNYFKEAEVTKRRDTALSNMKEALGAGSDTYRALAAAMTRSISLMELEYYSMRLTIGAKGYPLSEFPEEIQHVILAPEDWSLSPEEKDQKAMAVLFGEEYMSSKHDIESNVNTCLHKILKDMEDMQFASSQQLIARLQNLVILIALLLASVIVSTLLSFRLIFRPLHRDMQFVASDQPLPVEGASEIQVFVRTYNAMYEENRKRKAELRFDATHDVLTGLYNRKAYEDIYKAVDKKSIALILIDADHFKTINDTYGHEIGDELLSKIAFTLKGSFRSDDFVCRIGGDEFAVIMANASSSLANLVESKLRQVNEILRSPEDSLPPITLSAGIAFGDRLGVTDTMFNAADAALYDAKRSGRSTCSFAE